VWAGNRPKGVGGAFPVERPVRTRKRSFAKQGLKAKLGDSGHSRVAKADPDISEGERRHLAIANWRCRPEPGNRSLELKSAKQSSTGWCSPSDWIEWIRRLHRREK
jgi:hypothetical protein